MTLIECLDHVNVDNVVGSLYLKPEKVVFLGMREDLPIHAERYRQFFAGRGIRTRVESHHLTTEDIASMTRELVELLRRERECVVDLNGGEEPVIMALGAAVAMLTPKEREKVSYWTAETAEGIDSTGALTVRELIALHGGVIYPKQKQPDSRYSPRDLDKLWQIVKADPKGWNDSVSALAEFESKSEDKERIELSRSDLAGSISKFREKEEDFQNLLDKLSREDIIRDRSDWYTIRYSYKDPLLRYCMRKAGNALEVKTLLEARALRENGKPYFQDCQMGVTIDWDGIVHNAFQRGPETRNEIDLILIHGLTPVFISCKNGNVEDEELYKLNTVASRFGGQYAKKMLIVTDLDQKGQGVNPSFARRAEDMKITLVSNAANLTAQGWQEVLRKATEE